MSAEVVGYPVDLLEAVKRIENFLKFDGPRDRINTTWEDFPTEYCEHCGAEESTPLSVEHPLFKSDIRRVLAAFDRRNG